jgi:hypothetical protein
VVDEREREKEKEKGRGSFPCTTGTRERNLVRRYEGVKEVRLEREGECGKRRRVNSIIAGFINWGCRPSLIRTSKQSRGRALFRATRTQITVHEKYLGHAYSP